MKLQTAKGVQDVFPEEKIIKNKIVGVLREVFELYGFAPLETPVLERYETLAAKFAAGESSDVLKETFKLKDQGKRKLGLRFDLTVPLARFIAMNPNLKMPFKRYEMGAVFRDGPIKSGRVRQFWQCDVDTIGSKSMLAEAEILAVVDTFFKKLKTAVVVKVNNRKLLNGILEQVGIRKKEEAIIAIDKLDKIGVKGVRSELIERGYTQGQIKKVFSFIKEGVGLRELKSKVVNEEGKEGLKELEELFSYLKMMGVTSAVFDVSLARGLAYYTSTVFEAFLKSPGSMTSSLAGGGRWDQMIGKFMGGEKEIPAVGVAFGLVPIMEALREKKEFKEKTPAKVFVIPIKVMKEGLDVVRRLREDGVKCDIDMMGRGVSKNLNYASTLGIPYVVLIGEKEVKAGKVLLRDMETGDEKLLSVKRVVKELR